MLCARCACEHLEDLCHARARVIARLILRALECLQYMGQNVFQPGFKNSLYGRRVGMFAGPGHFSYWVYTRMFLTGTICKLSIISSQQSGMEYYFI